MYHSVDAEAGGFAPPTYKGQSSRVKYCVGILAVTQIITLGLLFNNMGGADIAPTSAINLDKRTTRPFPDATLGDVMAAMPGHKLNIPHVTPRANQMHRGTCWDFATIGMLEWSYRNYGIERGWLKPDEYVAFSEQAYGVAVVEACQESPQKCLIPQDNIWLGSTEGGEIPILYSLPGMGSSIVPHSVCPYQPNPGPNENACPNLEKVLDTNPISFTVEKMHTLYEVEAIKRHLREHGRVLGFSTAMTKVQYFQPCIGKRASDPACKRDEDGQCQVMCPIERFPAGMCCLSISMPNYNAEGEFYSRGDTDYMEGGHAMVAVGYNDNFVTQDGSVGGFILKNNWLTNASHSIGYYMQEISHWDENILCPNSANPRNWYTCENLKTCMSPKSRLYAQVSGQMIELRCKLEGACEMGEEYTYFIKNYTHVGDGMHAICVLEHNAKTGQGKEICMDPLVLDSLARILTPKNPVENDPDHCGFFFIPYKAVQSWWSRFHQSYATDFVIRWDDSSYLANEKKFPHLDYSQVRASTYKQRQVSFEGPIPYDHISEPNRTEMKWAQKRHRQEQLKKEQVLKDNP